MLIVTIYRSVTIRLFDRWADRLNSCIYFLAELAEQLLARWQ